MVEVPDFIDASELFVDVVITMPTTLHDDLRTRARAWGLAVTELIQRAVELDDALYGPEGSDRVIILREPDGFTERMIWPRRESE